jgi:hypothetical protein
MTRTGIPRAGLAALSLLLLAGLAIVGIVRAGSSANYAVGWSVLSGSGAPAGSSSGTVALNGTLGQTAIGASTGTGATVGAGFWYGLGGGAYEIYLPVTLRNYP